MELSRIRGAELGRGGVGLSLTDFAGVMSSPGSTSNRGAIGDPGKKISEGYDSYLARGATKKPEYDRR